MRLTKKHIGGLFQTFGADGSWHYQLLDIKDGMNLFYSSSGRYEIEPNSHSDWESAGLKFDKIHIRNGWKYGRVSK